MTERRYRGDYIEGQQDFSVRFDLYPTVYIQVLTNVESWDHEDSFSEEEIIEAALTTASHVGAGDICASSDEVTIEDAEEVSEVAA